jgi:hypothetical protein
MRSKRNPAQYLFPFPSRTAHATCLDSSQAVLVASCLLSLGISAVFCCLPSYLPLIFLFYLSLYNNGKYSPLMHPRAPVQGVFPPLPAHAGGARSQDAQKCLQSLAGFSAHFTHPIASHVTSLLLPCQTRVQPSLC